MPVYRDGGTKIKWTVEESVVPAGYTASVDDYVITNTHVTATTSYGFTKVWDDANDQDGKRANFTVTLYKATVTGDANSVVYSATGIDNPVELSGDDTSYTWYDLPLYEDGKTIIWSVKETVVPDGYTVTYDPANFEIKNSYTPETTSITVTKV